MEDEKQAFKNLLKQPYSRQALDDICDAFDDLRGPDRRALLAEFKASPLGVDIEKFTRQLREKLIAQIEPIGRIDQDRVIRHFAPLLALHFAREKRKRPEITEAVIAVRGHNTPDAHPHTVAARILDKVNAWLKEHDYKPVLIDALARRIPRT